MSSYRASFRAVLLGLATFAASAAVTPDPVYQALRQAPIAESFVVENIVLHRDAGTLTLKTGSIGFTAPVQGRDTVAVFSGDAEFTLAPAMAIEKNYLKSLTEQESIKESFDRALFCFTDDTGKEIRGQAKTKADAAKLNDILHDYRKRLRDESNENVEAELLGGLYGLTASRLLLFVDSRPQTSGAAVCGGSARRRIVARPGRSASRQCDPARGRRAVVPRAPAV